MKGLRPHLIALLTSMLVTAPAVADRVDVLAEPGALAAAIAGASPGDELILAPGQYDGPVTIDVSLVLDGGGAALIIGNEVGSVIRWRRQTSRCEALRLADQARTVPTRMPGSSWIAARTAL